MSDKEIWLLFFHAFLSQSTGMSVGVCAAEADEALEIYKEKWDEAANE
jgi:hypothetical protein